MWWDFFWQNSERSINEKNKITHVFWLWLLTSLWNVRCNGVCNDLSDHFSPILWDYQTRFWTKKRCVLYFFCMACSIIVSCKSVVRLVSYVRKTTECHQMHDGNVAKVKRIASDGRCSQWISYFQTWYPHLSCHWRSDRQAQSCQLVTWQHPSLSEWAIVFSGPCPECRQTTWMPTPAKIRGRVVT